MTTTRTTPYRRPLRRSAALAAAALITTLSACGTDATTGSTGGASADGHPPGGATETEATEKEAATLAPRVLLAHDGGLTLLDSSSGEVVEETMRDGFLRLDGAGDGRHVVVSDGDVFRVYDTGIRSEAHGDHAHHYISPAGLTDITFDAPHAGHVVVHDRLTTLFADGTGEIQHVESSRIADPDAPVVRRRTEHPHHGVALELANGHLVTTQGTEEERRTVQVLDGSRVVAATDDCAGVHGEALARPTAKGEVVVLGCEDGPVVLRDGIFHKVEVDAPYLRTGNLAGHPGSPVVLADHKTDPDAELERPTKVSLVDARTDTLRAVELGSAYWFRSLGRGPHGEALVLTYDGTLRVLDPRTGKETDRVEVVAPWREPDDWQSPGPALEVSGSHAYVSDPASGELVVVDLNKGEVVDRFDVPEGVVELAVTTGTAPWDEEHAH